MKWTKADLAELQSRLAITGTNKIVSPRNRNIGLIKKRRSSPLENRFERLWCFYHGPFLIREYQFHLTRKWRFDFALPEKKIAIEIEGACWVQGRHTRGSGFVKDAEKYLEATLLGWTIYRLPEPLLTADNIQRIIQTAETPAKP